LISKSQLLVFLIVIVYASPVCMSFIPLVWNCILGIWAKLLPFEGLSSWIIFPAILPLGVSAMIRYCPGL